jgi:hypothetical protein
MKTLEEQIKEMQDRLNKLENNLTERSEEFEPCCIAECDCGCDEPETEVNDDGPEYDSAGFTYEDRVVDGQYRVRDNEPSLDTVIDAPEPEECKYTFTESELIKFTKELIQRSLDNIKDILDNVTINDDDHVSLELGWDNQIQIDLDGERIKREIMDEIEDGVSFNDSDILDEISNVLSDMESEG